MTMIIILYYYVYKYCFMHFEARDETAHVYLTKHDENENVTLLKT